MLTSSKSALLLTFVAALCVPAGNAHAQRGGDAPERGQRGAQRGADDSARTDVEPRLAILPDAAEWQDLLANDARITFTQRTTGEARSVLDTPESSEEQRAVSMVALGASGAIVERTRLERVARSGSTLERRAAVLALGEMSAGSNALLEEWIAGAEPAIAECALLALLRSERSGGRRRVEEIAADPSHRLASVAADMIVFTVDRPSSVPTRATVLLLRLRFEGARLFGLVDGETWEGLIVRRLAQDEAFVRDIVLSAAGDLRGGAARDHVFAELLHGTGKARLRAAVALLPSEISALVENDLWRPADDDEWLVVLEEIEARRVERLALPLLRAALEVPAFRYRAMAWAAIAGDEDEGAILASQPARLSIEDRQWLALAIGAHPDPALIERFATMGDDKDARVRMAFLVARFRHQDRKAGARIAEALADAESPDHEVLLEAMFRAAADPGVAGALENRAINAPVEEATRIAVTLGLAGRTTGRKHVRTALLAVPAPDAAESARMVRALRRHATADDLVVLRQLFPSVTGERMLDRELTLSLIEQHEPEILPILRAALWTANKDVSLIAGGLMVEVAGIRSLIGELRGPPDSATSGDLRRIGFAIGEWGGVPAIALLARELRWQSGDPALQGALLGMLATRTQ